LLQNALTSVKLLVLGCYIYPNDAHICTVRQWKCLI